LKAFLLAAGKGLRLRPYTETTPKCLIEIKKKPLLSYWLEELEKNNINKIFINTSYKSEKVKNYIIGHKNSNKIKILHEKKLLGTAGSLLKNINYFRDDSLLLIHADNFTKFPLSKLIKAHKSRPNKCLITMMIFRSNTPKTCGIVELDEEKVVQNFIEKPKNPKSNLANCAIYILSKKFFTDFKIKKNVFDFSLDIIPNFLGKIFTVKINDKFFDIGHLKTYNQVK
jgi:mannose-1-phosphate guanylyltransferase